MSLKFLDWAIVAAVLGLMMYGVVFSRRFMKSVADFLAAGRTAGRYLISVSMGMAMLGAISVVGEFEMFFKSGFCLRWWELSMAAVILIVTVSGWVYYRFRQTRALTLAQFFEARYSRSFRVFGGLLSFISGLINCAGISQVGPLEEYPIEKMKALFQTNVFGAVQMTQAFLPRMRRNGKGFIINIGSLAGKFAIPFQAGYVASKYAVAGWSWALRGEVSPYGIRVVVIEPNDIRTTITPELNLFPESDYCDNVECMKKVRAESMKKACGPEVVARKVIKILRSKKPRPFYTVGGAGPLMVFLKRFIPDALLEKLIKRNYGLK